MSSRDASAAGGEFLKGVGYVVKDSVSDMVQEKHSSPTMGKLRGRVSCTKRDAPKSS